MKAATKILPWAFLNQYRGQYFDGEWPTFPELLKIQKDRFGDRPYFSVFEGTNEQKVTLTYAQVYEKVVTLAHWMIEQGVRKGDKICVSGKNSPEWGVVFLATFFASGIIVPIDNGLHENEVINLIKTSSPKIIFADDEKCLYLEKAFPSTVVRSLNPTNFSNYVFNLVANDIVPLNPPVSENDTAAILFTSGTTGNPKGVMLSHKNLICDGYIAQTNLLITSKDVFYALLPIHHAYTMQAAFICPLEVGAEIVFGKSMAVTRFMKELREGKISIMLGVPLLYNKLLAGINKGISDKGSFVYAFIKFLGAISFVIRKLTGKNIGKSLFKPILKKANIYTLRVAICGGGPLAPSVFRQYNDMGINFIQGYGLTETSPIITLNPVEHFKIESVGRAFVPYEDIKLIHTEKVTINRKQVDVGEIVIKGPMVMQGYYKMPEETKEMLTEDGYLKTGDLGWIDEEQYVMLCGRAKNLIVTSGGKNVYPEEIEDAFQLYTDIQQITIQGYYNENDKTSEEIEALIYISDELYKRLNEERNSVVIQESVYKEIKAIVSKVNKTLQQYAQITRIRILKEPMETTTTLKVKRSALPKCYQM